MLEERIGSRRALQIFSILEACRARGIPVVLSSVPDLGLLLRSKAGGPQNWHQKELALLARRFGADYFDGYEAFADVAADRLAEDYWLRGDGHWNSRGSDHYAEQLFRFLTARLGSMAEARSSPRGARSTR